MLKFSPDGSILGVAGACSLPSENVISMAHCVCQKLKLLVELCPTVFLVDPLKQTHAALAPVGWDSSCGSVRQLCFSADSSHLV